MRRSEAEHLHCTARHFATVPLGECSALSLYCPSGEEEEEEDEEEELTVLVELASWGMPPFILYCLF